MTRRYFEGSHPQLTARLEAHFDRMRAGWPQVSEKASALALGGGYGRGEGGVTTDGTEAGFFNDLDYFLFTATPDDPDLAKWCSAMERDETARLGVDVEIKRLPEDDVHAGLATMMFADLVAGHVPVAGDCTFLETLNVRLDFTTVGAADATRLLWNRGSGLFFSRAEMERDPVFVLRNHAKAKLAMGDALLCLKGQYVPQCRERGRRFAELILPDGFEKLRTWHAEAVEFKFKPLTGSPGMDAMLRESGELAVAWLKTFLHVESARLGKPGLTLSSYLDLPRVMPETPLWKNLALALRDRLKRRAALKPWADYPRGALMRALPCLLELDGRTTTDAVRFLPSPAAGETWHDVYLNWWRHYC